MPKQGCRAYHIKGAIALCQFLQPLSGHLVWLGSNITILDDSGNTIVVIAKHPSFAIISRRLVFGAEKGQIGLFIHNKMCSPKLAIDGRGHYAIAHGDD